MYRSVASVVLLDMFDHDHCDGTEIVSDLSSIINSVSLIGCAVHLELDSIGISDYVFNCINDIDLCRMYAIGIGAIAMASSNHCRCVMYMSGCSCGISCILGRIQLFATRIGAY